MLETISTEPIKTMEDWDGLLVGTTSPSAASIVQNLGGSSVNVPWTDMYSALEKGVVDATILATPFFTIGQLFDVTSYVIYSGVASATYGTTVNQDVWNSMPKSIQTILLEEMQQSGDILNQVHIEIFENVKGELADLGLEVYILPKDERDRWKETLTPYADEQIASLGEFGEQLKEIADEVNAQNPY